MIVSSWRTTTSRGLSMWAESELECTRKAWDPISPTGTLNWMSTCWVLLTTSWIGMFREPRMFLVWMVASDLVMASTLDNQNTAARKARAEDAFGRRFIFCHSGHVQNSPNTIRKWCKCSLGDRMHCTGFYRVRWIILHNFEEKQVLAAKCWEVSEFNTKEFLVADKIFRLSRPTSTQIIRWQFSWFKTNGKKNKRRLTQHFYHTIIISHCFL